MNDKKIPGKIPLPPGIPLPTTPTAWQTYAEQIQYRIQAFQAAFNNWQTCRKALHKKKNQRWPLRRRFLKGMAQAALVGSLLIHSLPLNAPTPVLADAVPLFSQGADNPFGLTDIGAESKPTFADLDGDGDLDALVGATDGNLKYFQNTGSSNAPAFATVSDNPFGLTNIGSYSGPNFSDIDADGDLDLFVGAYDGNLKYFENTGTAINPAFAAVSDNPFGLSDAGFRSTIYFADLDGDSDLDAFAGESTGSIKYFQNTGTSVTPAFAASVNNPFGLTNVGNFSNLTFADLDDDGDLDAFIGHVTGNIRYFENTGTAIAPAFAPLSDNPFGLASVGVDSSPTFADLDADGDLDAFVGATDGTINYFQNTAVTDVVGFQFVGINPFSIQSATYFPSPVFADLDSDGDFDLFAGEAYSGAIRYSRNIGTPKIPAFGGAIVTNPFGLSTSGAAYNNPAFADLDGDGDLDVFMGMQNGSIRHQENTGDAFSPAFGTASINPFGLTDIGSEAAPTFADLDSDGDLDAFIGALDGSFHYLQNTGTAINPAFVAPVLNPFGVNPLPGKSVPKFADLDNDGDLDLVTGEKYGQTGYFENTGTVISPAFVNRGNGFLNIDSVTLLANPALTDLDADGDLDILIGQYFSNFYYYRNAPEADVAISKTVSQPVLLSGSPVTYTLQYSNTGSALAQSVLISDIIPSEIASLSYQSSPPLSTQGGQNYHWAVGLMSPHQSGVITVTGVVTNNLEVNSIDNTAQIITASPEFTNTNNSDTVSSPTFRVEATKADSFQDLNGDLQPNPGETITYDVTVVNPTSTDGLPLTNVTFNDTPDLNTLLSVGSVTTSQGTVISGNNGGDTNVAVDIGAIADGDTVAIQFDVVINPDFPHGVSNVINQGQASSDTFTNLPTDDPDTSASGDSTITPITIPPADLSITKTASPPTASPGDSITYTLTYLNNATNIAESTRITDIIPLAISGVTVQSTNLITPVGAINYIWDVGDLGLGEGGIITITGILGTIPAGPFINTGKISSPTPDSNLINNTSQVTITIQNIPPVAVNDPVMLLEDSSPTSIDVVSNDIDENGDSLIITAVGPGNLGSTPTISNNQIVYQPPIDRYSPESFPYTITDGIASDSAFVTVAITPVNDAPSFTAGADVIVNEDSGPQNLAGWATDINPGPYETQALTFLLSNDNNALFATQPTLDSSTGLLSFLTAPDISGSTVVSVTLQDDGGTANGGVDTSATIAFNLTVTPVEDAPQADDDTISTDEDTAVSATLIVTEPDPGDFVTYIIGDYPTEGTALVDSNGLWTYTPVNLTADYTATFTILVTDTTSLGDEATINVLVSADNDLPVANDDGAITTQGSPVGVNVLVNDSDPENTALTITDVSLPDHGSTADDGFFIVYTPINTYLGLDSFIYTVSDGVNTVTATAIMTITTTDGNIPPQIHSTPVTSATVGSPYFYSITTSDPDGTVLTMTAPTKPGWLTFVDNGDGTASLSGTPNLSHLGWHDVLLNVDDGFDIGSQSYSIFVYPVGTPDLSLTKTASVPGGDAELLLNQVVTYTLTLNNNGDGAAVDVVLSDTLPSGLTFGGFVQQGSALLPGNNAVSWGPYHIYSQTTYTIIFTATVDNNTDLYGQTLTNTATYNAAYGGSGATEAAVLVVFNAPPTISAIPNQSTPVDTSAGPIPFTISDLETAPEDLNLSGQAADATLVPPGNIVFGGSGANRTVTITPAAGLTGLTAITLTVSDEGFNISTSFMLAVGTNGPPNAYDDNATVSQNGHVFIDVLANDTDPDDDTLSVGGVGQPGNGQTGISGTHVIYTPTLNFMGSDTFTYTASDGDLSDMAQVTVNVITGTDLSISQTYTRTDTSIEITLVARNLGPQNAAGATVFDTFPANITGINWTCQVASGASCSPFGSGNNLNDTLLNFPVGGVATYTIVGAVDPFQTIVNTAIISLPTRLTDPDFNNNISTITAPLTGYEMFVPLILKGF